MTAKALKNPALREKFHVGDTVRLPHNVWTTCSNKLVNFVKVDQTIVEVGDKIIHHGKNRLCRFSITLGEGYVIWEEWMLEKIEVLSKAATVETRAIEGDETSLPPHE